jgi:hypothetical protein
MFPRRHIARALWDVLFFISEMFSTAFCDDQTIISEHYTGNISETFFPNSGVGRQGLSKNAERASKVCAQNFMSGC